MISDDLHNSRETLSFPFSLLTKQIAFPIDLSPGLDLFRFRIIRRYPYVVPKD